MGSNHGRRRWRNYPAAAFPAAWRAAVWAAGCPEGSRVLDWPKGGRRAPDLPAALYNGAMTPQELAADRAVCDAAPAGPWSWGMRWICQKSDYKHLAQTPTGDMVERGDVWEKIADFAVEARTRWPAALDEIERLRRDIDALVEVLVDHNIGVPQQFQTFGKLAQLQKELREANEEIRELNRWINHLDPPTHVHRPPHA